ncbi:MAG: hypothetical protein R3E44_16565 [Paracoccaceae bacterium]
MVGLKRIFTAGRLGAAALVALAVLAGCARDRLEPTACVDGQPVIARTLDVAPPNC